MRLPLGADAKQKSLPSCKYRKEVEQVGFAHFEITMPSTNVDPPVALRLRGLRVEKIYLLIAETSTRPANHA